MSGQLDMFDQAADRPTLRVTNWNSKKLHGPGKHWTIMAKPRRWEHGDGVTPLLVPKKADLEEVKGGRLGMPGYRARFEERFRERLGDIVRLQVGILAPGQLKARTKDTETFVWHETEVKDGDTLCCACSREAATNGECHRVWAAELLVRAGWRVILDGVES